MEDPAFVDFKFYFQIKEKCQYAHVQSYGPGANNFFFNLIYFFQNLRKTNPGVQFS